MSQHRSSGNQRMVRDVVFVDGVRTPFGRAGEKGIYAGMRADDLVVKCIRELMRRNPGLPAERIDEVAVAATTQTGDQGLTIGRTAALLAGLPRTVPGFAIDRMCAGAMTAVTTTASGIGFGAYDVVIAGGVEHMGNHPMGAGADPNPRFVSERLVDPAALNMGNTAENLHDRFPHITKDAMALVSAVDHPNVKMMLDLYHAQIGEGNLIELVRAALPWIGEVQVADVPGRFEPGTGEINYRAVATALTDAGYSGVIGLEAGASGGQGPTAGDAALAAFRAAFAD